MNDATAALYEATLERSCRFDLFEWFDALQQCVSVDRASGGEPDVLFKFVCAHSVVVQALILGSPFGVLSPSPSWRVVSATSGDSHHPLTRFFGGAH
jgi:hypothetical protein